MAHPLRGFLVALAALVAWDVAARAPLARATQLDSGTYKVFLEGHPVAEEIFFFDVNGDTVTVQSGVRGVIRTKAGVDSVKKSCLMAVNAFDLDMRYYRSTQILRGVFTKRVLTMNDTSFTASREVGEHGEAEVLVRPPGRIYMRDSELYVLFDVIARNLHTQSFDSRPITMLMLGRRDTTLEITARRLKPAPLRWGKRVVQSERLVLDDGASQILMWLDPRGRLLRLEQGGGRLVVERQPSPAKPTSPHKAG